MRKMRNLYLATLLLAAVGTYADYLLHPSISHWENTPDIGGSQSGDDGVPGIGSGITDAGLTAGGSSGSGSGSGVPFIDLEIPVCMDDELLEFNGTVLACKKIPERKCICPEPMSGSGDMVLLPEPPGGCPVFQPPVGGAFVCTRMGDMVIHCSVLCDNEHEFSTFPVNPYFCGLPSKFKWTDFTNVTHDDLPQCSGFRYTLRTLHREQFYLPNKCSSLNATEMNTVKKDFCCLLMGIPSRRVCAAIDCDTEDIYIQCPPTGIDNNIPY